MATRAPIASKPPESLGRSRIHGTVRSLRHRNFQLFFSGQLISLIGTWMQTIAQAWLVYRITGSSLLLGVGGIRRPDSDFYFVTAGRAGSGSLEPPQNCDRDADCLDDPGVHFGGDDADATREQYGISWSGGWLLGRSTPFDIPASRQFLIEMVSREEPDERDRVELFDVQRRAESVGQSPGFWWRGLAKDGVSSPTPCQLYRGDRWADDDEAGPAYYRGLLGLRPSSIFQKILLHSADGADSGARVADWNGRPGCGSVFRSSRNFYEQFASRTST